MNKLLLTLILLLTPSLALAQVWPNQPSGSTTLGTTNFDTRCDNGFQCEWTTGEVVSDPTAPASPPNVFQHTWQNHSFSDIANPHFNLPANVRTLYFGMWWKPSGPPFYGWSNNQNKITLHKINTAGGRNLYMLMNGAQGGDSWSLGFQFAFDVSNSHLPASNGDAVGPRNLFANIASSSVTLGQWHRIEQCFTTSTTPSSQDGVVRLWVDGKLVMAHNNANYGAQHFTIARIDQVWDARDTSPIGQGKTDFHRYDQARVAVGGVCPGDSAPSPIDTPSGAPGPVTGVTVTVQ